MKAVMISIKPKLVERIASGEKTIEVRKTAPKLKTPFKCFIYMTKNGKIADFGADRNKLDVAMFLRNSGKVIGEFVCDKIYNFVQFGAGIMFADENLNQLEPQLARDMTCLTDNEIENYLGNKDGYGLHISNLKIYDKPKEIGKFQTPPCEKSEKACKKCKYLVKIDTPDMYEVDCFVENGRPIIRPPQSWCYVEELKEN